MSKEALIVLEKRKTDKLLEESQGFPALVSILQLKRSHTRHFEACRVRLMDQTLASSVIVSENTTFTVVPGSRTGRTSTVALWSSSVISSSLSRKGMRMA